MSAKHDDRVLFEQLANHFRQMDEMTAILRSNPAVQGLQQWEALWTAALDRWARYLPERIHLDSLPLTNLCGTVLNAINRREAAMAGQSWREFWAEIDTLQERLDELVPDPTILFYLQERLEAISQEQIAANRLLSAQMSARTSGFPSRAWSLDPTVFTSMVTAAVLPENPVGPEVQLAHDHVYRLMQSLRFRHDERMTAQQALPVWKQATSVESMEAVRTTVTTSGYNNMRWWLGFSYGKTPKPPRIKGSIVLVDVSASCSKLTQGYESESQIRLLSGLSGFCTWARERLGLTKLDLDEFWFWNRHDRKFEVGRRFQLSPDMAIVLFANKVTLEMSALRAEALNEYCSEPGD